MAGLEGLKEHYDLVIVGAGLSGAVFAEQAASRLGLTSLIIDKRDHIGVCGPAAAAAAAQRVCVRA
jgi:UDP-galactopyranose mutase